MALKTKEKNLFINYSKELDTAGISGPIVDVNNKKYGGYYLYRRSEPSDFHDRSPECFIHNMMKLTTLLKTEVELTSKDTPDEKPKGKLAQIKAGEQNPCEGD